MTTQVGKVWLVGAGPGDPGLITARGLDLLRHAEAVVYDRLAAPALLDETPLDAERHDAGKTPGAPGRSARQEEINALLVRLARAGKRVVRLKGGDPFVFGRGGEEALALEQAGIPWEVVPGVSAALAAPAYAGIPVTHRGLAQTFIVATGHAGLEHPGRASADTVVVLMAVEHLAASVGALLADGRAPDTPAALVHAATTPRQRTVRATLGSIVEAARQAGLRAPATLVVSPTAALADHLAWFDRRPLLGRCILVAHTRPEPSDLTAMLREQGADTVKVPRPRVVPVADAATALPTLQALAAGAFAWVVYPGAATVRALWALLRRAGLDSRAVNGRVCAFGPGTAAALQIHGIHPDWCSHAYYADAIADGLAQHGATGQRVLLPSLDPESTARLAEALASRGMQAEALAVGQLSVDAPAERARVGDALATSLDLALFPASRSVDAVLDLLDGDVSPFANVSVLCAGPTTAARAKARGLAVTAVAEDASRPGMLAAAMRLLAGETAPRA